MDRKQAELLEHKKPSTVSFDADSINKADEFCREYRTYMDAARTERESVDYAVALAEKNGFKPYVSGEKLKAGDKVYYVNHAKSIMLAVIGSKGMSDGARIIASHIDSPRLDLKPVPLYEAGGMCYFKTHYYGGVKKYQWTALPLELHGVIFKNGTEKINVNVGGDDGDPIFYISDLMPHIGKDQMSKNASDFIPGESLNIICGSTPIDSDGGVKLGILALLNKKYGISERDLTTAELTAVPAIKSREVGFDGAMIAAYGHDDRICAYPALSSLISLGIPEHTAVVFLADKEEIGSYGVTGLGCDAYVDFLEDLCESTDARFRDSKRKTVCLSADVGGAYDPTFADAYEARNSAYMNGGVVISKYTGSRGKSGCSDASAETLAKLASVFDKAGVVWQVGEYGKVDQGGAGTVACEIARFGIEVIDCGVPILSMHSPVELASKFDIYEMRKASDAFFES